MSITIMSYVTACGPVFDGSKRNVLLCLADFANDEGFCYPSREAMAWTSGTSEKTVQRAIAQLSRLGVLAIEKRKGRTNLYRMNVRLLSALAGRLRAVRLEERQSGDRAYPRAHALAAQYKTELESQQFSYADLGENLGANDDLKGGQIDPCNQNNTVDKPPPDDPKGGQIDPPSGDCVSRGSGHLESRQSGHLVSPEPSRTINNHQLEGGLNGEPDLDDHGEAAGDGGVADGQPSPKALDPDQLEGFELFSAIRSKLTGRQREAYLLEEFRLLSWWLMENRGMNPSSLPILTAFKPDLIRTGSKREIGSLARKIGGVSLRKMQSAIGWVMKYLDDPTSVKEPAGFAAVLLKNFKFYGVDGVVGKRAQEMAGWDDFENNEEEAA